ncbi:MAG TPA: glyoxalase/bleomycin resistance/extradiol dioxygenase family protein [Bryobacteraceae bacterium]|jgi:PhnB protein|nr:glyoxalase/bleomycin resistance/extradiol dioxygenase family protein [Bryobacteraceae bacterium]
MSVQKLNPYLQFNGNAAKAIELYERALGAKVESLMRHGDMPNATPEKKDLIMHAALKIGGGELMLSDEMFAAPIAGGKNFYVALHLDDVADAEKMFAALSAGGTVTQPFVDTFWGAKFGMLVDAFGVQWMFNCELKKQAA